MNVDGSLETSSSSGSSDLRVVPRSSHGLIVDPNRFFSGPPGLLPPSGGCAPSPPHTSVSGPQIQESTWIRTRLCAHFQDTVCVKEVAGPLVGLLAPLPVAASPSIGLPTAYSLEKERDLPDAFYTWLLGVPRQSQDSPKPRSAPSWVLPVIDWRRQICQQSSNVEAFAFPAWSLHIHAPPLPL